MKTKLNLLFSNMYLKPTGLLITKSQKLLNKPQ